VTLPGRDRLAVLVHEVRSPAAALAAIAEFSKNRRLEASARLRLVELAVAACRGIERLILDAAHASVRPEEVNIWRIVDEAVAAAALGGADVRAEIDAGIPVLQVDPLRLRQALDNLVANALRHGGSAGKVVVRARPTETAVLLSVIDQGPGIPFGDQERIFEAGVRLSAERPGSGLGLVVARSIVEAHGGALTVESFPDQGATFTIALPVS